MSTPNQEQLGAALDPGVPLAAAVEAAILEKTRLTFARVLAIAPDRPRRLLAMQQNRWDLANVIAVLRARLAGAEPNKTVGAVLAIGELDPSRLEELAAAPDVPGIADSLTAGGHAFTFVVRRAILECDAPRDPRALERSACAAFYRWVLAQLDPSDAAEAVVTDCIRWQVDLLNVLSLLGLVRAREHGGPLPEEEPIARGTIPAAFLARLGSSDSLESAFEALTETWFSPGIEKGILAYGQARSLAVMERFLEAVLIERACRLFRRDMLGVGVALGFIWRVYAELCNLRMLARGVGYRMTANAVREGLVLV
jgi:vacuolar-type H+-ATPase subunit C/Vma6